MSSRSVAIMVGLVCLVAGGLLAATGSPGDAFAGPDLVHRVMSAFPMLLAAFGLASLLLGLMDRATAATLAVAGSAALFVGHAVVYGEWLIDDAAISFTYARNFAEGHGLVLYPGEEPLEAYSNPLWVLLLAGGHALGISFVPLAKGLGIATGLGTLLLAWRIARRNLEVSTDLAAFVPLLLALNGVYVMWAISGLENPLLALMIVAAIWAVDEELHRERLPIFGPILCALLATVRPESVLYGGAIGLVAITLTPRKRRLAHSLCWVGLFALPFAAFLGVRYWYFGALVPNTYFAKSGAGMGGNLIAIATGVRYLLGAWVQQGAAIFVIVAVLGLWLRRNGTWLLLAAFAAGVVFVLKAGGDWMGVGRFVAHLTPIWAILAVAGLELVRRKGVPRRAVAVAAAVGLAFYGYVNYQIVENRSEDNMCPYERVATTGRWYGDLAERARIRDPVLATIDLGGTSLHSGMRVLDIAGLGNAEVARAMYEGGYGPEFFATFLAEQRPTFINVHSGWARDSGIPSLRLIDHLYYELDPPQPVQPARYHFVLKRELTATDADPGPGRAVGHGVELLSHRQISTSSGPSLLLLWRATRELAAGRDHVWTASDPNGDVVGKQGLLYGVVPPERVDVDRVHREYMPLSSSHGNLEVRLRTDSR